MGNREAYYLDLDLDLDLDCVEGIEWETERHRARFDLIVQMANMYKQRAGHLLRISVPYLFDPTQEVLDPTEILEPGNALKGGGGLLEGLLDHESLESDSKEGDSSVELRRMKKRIQSSNHLFALGADHQHNQDQDQDEDQDQQDHHQGEEAITSPISAYARSQEIGMQIGARLMMVDAPQPKTSHPSTRGPKPKPRHNPNPDRKAWECRYLPR